MNLRYLLSTACTLSLGLTANAWAVPTDAGSTDTYVEDVTSTVDAGPTEDTVVATDTATGDTSVPAGFSPNACWNTKCGKEIDACKADPACVTFHDCILKGDPKVDCTANLKQATYDLYSAVVTCGRPACADKNSGKCTGKCGSVSEAAMCNCDVDCSAAGDCCADMDTACGAPTCAGSDCADNAKGTWTVDKSPATCYCDTACAQYGDCCPDQETVCAGPTCTPDCAGKVCGPDGCGKSCGTCKAGETCDKTVGTCSASAPDAGSTDTGTTGGADAGGIAADTGSTTTTTDSTGSSATSSGCTAGSTSNGAGWMSALVALGFIVAMRRRRA